MYNLDQHLVRTNYTDCHRYFWAYPIFILFVFSHIYIYFEVNMHSAYLIIWCLWQKWIVRKRLGMLALSLYATRWRGDINVFLIKQHSDTPTSVGELWCWFYDQNQIWVGVGIWVRIRIHIRVRVGMKVLENHLPLFTIFHCCVLQCKGLLTEPSWSQLL